MEPERIGIVVGAKGRGTNMRSIVCACQRGEVRGRVAAVVSPLESNPAAVYASENGLPLRVVPFGPDYESRMTEALQDCTLVCLAGFMRLLPSNVLAEHPNRVLNIHPALLPKHGGKGMYGLHVHEAVIAAGEVESGCTVHRVTPEYDEGDIILQKRCPVFPDDTPETLAARVLALEVKAYPEAIQMIIDGNSS